MNKPRILIIDDNQSLCMALSNDLRTEGYDPETAPGLEEGMEELRKSKFDLLIIEPFSESISKGKFSSKEFWETFHKENSDCKILVLTKFANLKNAIDSYKFSAGDFISKPYDLVDLLTSIDRVIGEKGPCSGITPSFL